MARGYKFDEAAIRELAEKVRALAGGLDRVADEFRDAGISEPLKVDGGARVVEGMGYIVRLTEKLRTAKTLNELHIDEETSVGKCCTDEQPNGSKITDSVAGHGTKRRKSKSKDSPQGDKQT